MSFKSQIWTFVLFLFVSGCRFTAPPVAPTQTGEIRPTVAIAPQPEHFDPAPRIERPPRPTTAETEGQLSGTSVNGPIAQVMTPVESGTLSEVDVGIVQGSQGPLVRGMLLVELRSIEGGRPSDDSVPPLFRGVVPISKLPVSRGAGEVTRLDFRPFRVILNKNAPVAIVLSAVDTDVPNNLPLSSQTVNGHSYTGGLLYRFESGSWQADGFPLQLLFRVYATQSPTITSTGPALPVTAGDPPEIPLNGGAFRPAGRVIAQCLPKPAVPQVYHRPTPAGKWQFRSHVFRHAGSWYLEFTAFNGTNVRDYGRRMGIRSITLTRAGELSGRVVYPDDKNDVADFGTMMAFQDSMPIAGTGTVRHYKLQDSTKPLSAGQYVVTVVMPTDLDEETLTTEFNVP